MEKFAPSFPVESKKLNQNEFLYAFKLKLKFSARKLFILVGGEATKAETMAKTVRLLSGN